MAKSTLPPPSSILSTSDTAESLVQEVTSQVKANLVSDIETTKAKLEKEARSFSNRIRNWISNQIDRLGNAVFALMIALLVATVTPVLVRWGIDDRLSSITQALNGLAEQQSVSQVFDNTLELDKKAQSLDTLNGQVLDSVGRIEDEMQALNTIEQQINSLATSKPDFEHLKSSVLETRRELNQKLGEISAAVNHLQPTEQKVRAPALNINELKQQVQAYAKQGRQLLEDGANYGKSRDYVRKVYYFTGMLDLPLLNSEQTTRAMQHIYNEEKPFNDIQRQVEETVLILTALEQGLSLL